MPSPDELHKLLIALLGAQLSPLPLKVPLDKASAVLRETQTKIAPAKAYHDNRCWSVKVLSRSS